MKFYQQQGANLNRTSLAESENVCECCKSFDHEATKYHIDDVECPRCGALCKCGCHRQQRNMQQSP